MQLTAPILNNTKYTKSTEHAKINPIALQLVILNLSPVHTSNNVEATLSNATS